MAFFQEAGYTLTVSDEPLTHARIAHKGNWLSGVVTASSTATGYTADGPAGDVSYEKWRPHDAILSRPESDSWTGWAQTGVAMSGARMTEDSSNGFHFILETGITLTAERHVLSADVTPNGRDEIYLRASEGGINYGAYFDLGARAIGTTQNCTARLSLLGDGTYRCEIVFTPNATAVGQVLINLTEGSETTNYQGDGSSGILVNDLSLSQAESTWDFDARAAKEADYLCIGAHNLGTAGAIVTLQYDGGGWQDVATFAPTDDSPIWVMFEPETRQNWRLSIVDANRPTIGNIKLGKALQAARPINYQSHAPLDFQRQTILRTNYSATGEILGRRVQRVRHETSFNINNVTAAWVRDNWRAFQVAAEDAPIYVAWRPGTHTGTDAVIFGECPQPPSAENTGPRDLMGVSFTVSAPGYD